MMWYDGGWGWGGWIVMTLFMVLFWAVLIVGLIALVRYLAGTRHHQQPGSPPPSGWGGGQNRGAENLLAERFARGEIDEDEYRRRLALLREHR
ncbi:SHOCT domain-containing protein [Streptomyces sp. MK7]|uniref:SHOCT domain-containing protein n=1 Tax=Streptomyces sp. MK7 TaxID=3067635 RepID=UPI00292EAD2D|nr:SHOCT domain-containing protein [Streptomyces sp. MK7]